MTDAPPKKKLPFKQRKKQSAPAPTPSDGKDANELDLFSRRAEMKPILEADRKRRQEKERRKAEAQARQERQSRTSEKRPLDEEDEEFFDAKERLSLGAVPNDQDLAADEATMVGSENTSFNTSTPPASKRTRTESGSASSRHHGTPSSAREGSPSLLRATRLRSAISTPSKASKTPSQPPPGLAVISLDSDDEDLKQAAKAPTRRADVEITEAETGQDETDEDDEFAEYIRKAEEEKKRLAAEAGGSHARVWLTSEIEGTQPAEIGLRLDQPFIRLREAWTLNQVHKHNVQFPCDPADLVLSWNREKVYNYGTLYSLGIRVDGSRVSNEAFGKTGLSSDMKKVHMEISTPEIFRRWEAARERKRRKDEADGLSEEEVVQVEEEDVKLRIVLKARELQDVKLTVRPETTAETLITAYRQLRGVDDQKKVSLWFDGGQLESQSTLEEADIEDMDGIDVQIS